MLVRVNECACYHATAESFGSYVRRRARALAVAGVLFVGTYLSALFCVDTAFFYQRFRSDAVAYYFLAERVATAKPAAATLAVNGPPLRFAVFAAALRAPLLVVSRSFDRRLRLVQVTNVFSLFILGVLSSYILSFSLGGRWAAACIGVPFLYLLADGIWQLEVWSFLTDNVFAVFIAAGLSLLPSVARVRWPSLRAWLLLMSFGCLTIAAFATKMTGVGLALSVGVLLSSMWAGRRWPLSGKTR